jgi:hypothetical protein
MFNFMIVDRLKRAFVTLLLIYCGSLFLVESVAYAATGISEVSSWLPTAWLVFKWSGIAWFVGAVIGFCYVTSPRSSYLGFIPIGIFLCWLATILTYGLFNSPDWGQPWITLWGIWKFSGILWFLAVIASILVIPDDNNKCPWLNRLSAVCWSVLALWLVTFVVTGLFI